MNYLKSIVPALLAGGMLMASGSMALADVETTTVKTTTVTSTDPLVLPAGVTYVVIDPATGLTKGSYDPIRKAVDFALSPGLVVIDPNTNNVVASFDAAGNLIALSSAPVYDPLLVSIDSRRADFDRVITQIKLKGTYDEAVVGGLRAALDQINAMEMSYKSSGAPLTYAQELALAVQLNELGDRLTPFSSVVTTTYTPLIGAKFISSGGQIVMVDSYGGRNLTLQRKIDAEYAAGRLSNNQVAKLKEELNDISSLQAKYTRGGHIKDSKQKVLTEKLDRVQTDMDKDIASINEKRARIGIKVN